MGSFIAFVEQTPLAGAAIIALAVVAVVSFVAEAWMMYRDRRER